MAHRETDLSVASSTIAKDEAEQAFLDHLTGLSEHIAPASTRMKHIVSKVRESATREDAEHYVEAAETLYTLSDDLTYTRMRGIMREYGLGFEDLVKPQWKGLLAEDYRALSEMRADLREARDFTGTTFPSSSSGSCCTMM